MRAFWAKGYEATSLADLMEATGLHKGSLYQAFGDKHSLFIQSLKRYLDEMHRQEREIMQSAESPLQGMRDVAHAMIELADGDENEDGFPKGCLAINTLIELAPHDEAIAAVMEQHMAGTRATVQAAVAAAQAAGEMATSRTPEAITAMMMTFMMGLAAGARGVLSKEQAHALADMQIDALAQ